MIGWWYYRGLVDPAIEEVLADRDRFALVQLVKTRREWRNQPNLRAMCVLGLYAIAWWGPSIFLRKYAASLGSRWMHTAIVFAVPLGFLILFFYVVRSWLFRPMQLALRLRGFDVCVQCGYWLRGLGDEVKNCPECGAAREERAR